jgi:hypothetical protein
MMLNGVSELRESRGSRCESALVDGLVNPACATEESSDWSERRARSTSLRGILVTAAATQPGARKSPAVRASQPKESLTGTEHV